MELLCTGMCASGMLGFFIGFWVVEVNIKDILEIPSDLQVSQFLRALAPHITGEVRYEIRKVLDENK